MLLRPSVGGHSSLVKKRFSALLEQEALVVSNEKRSSLSNTHQTVVSVTQVMQCDATRSYRAKGILGTEIFDDSAQKATETVLWNTHLMEGPIANILIGNDKTVGRLLLKSFLKSKSFERAVKKLSEKLVEKKVRKVLVANGVIKVLEVNDDSDETDGETEFLI